MAYTFDQIFAADPSNPERVASNGVVTIFAPGDEARTPLLVTTVEGMAIQNPVQVNDSGHGPAFRHETLDRVAWEGGGFSGFFTSYEGMKQEAVAARVSAGESAAAAMEAAANSVAPTAKAVEREIVTAGTPARTAVELVAGQAAMQAVAPKIDRTEAVSAIDAVWTRVQETLRQISVTVTDLGAVGNDIMDSHGIIQGALNDYRYVYFPAGNYVTSKELKVPSNTYVVGQGKAITRIRLGDGAPRTANTLTNAGNNQTAHTTPDRGIHLRGITFDGNAPGKQQSGGNGPFPTGSCVAFACVENSSVTDCHFTRGYLHGLDISASAYIEEGNLTAKPIGPSRFVVVRDCTADWVQADDAFTTHASGDILFENCRADRLVPGAPPVVFSSQGFEVDDGSFRVTLRNCYARGYTKGFQVKGHEGSVPSRDVLLDACVAEGNNVNFELAHIGTLDVPAALGRLARNVQLNSCTSIAPALSLTTGEYPGLRALNIIGYDGVTLTNFTLTDGARNGVRLSDGASNVTFNTVNISDTQTDTEDINQGMFHCYGTVGKNISFRNINVHTPIIGNLINHVTGTYFTVENVQGMGSSGTGYVVNASSFGEGASIRNVTGTGYTAPIRVGAGPAAGNDAARTSVAPLEPLWAGSATAASRILGGAGAPAVAAPVGSVYLRTNGAAATSFYVKESGTGTTGWVAK